MKRFTLVDQNGDRLTDCHGDTLPDFEATSKDAPKVVELKPFRVVMEKRSTFDAIVYAIDENEAEDIAIDQAWEDLENNGDGADEIEALETFFDDSEEPLDEDCDEDEDEDCDEDEDA